MTEVYSGNLKTVHLIDEIIKEVARLKEGVLNKRTMRQIIDGENFIKMLKAPPYCRAATVGELKRTIKEERECLKRAISECNMSLPGYQFTFWEPSDEPSEAERKEIEQTRKNLNEKAIWLHKCLGMCCSKGYFN